MLKNRSEFHIKTLNQEKLFNELSKVSEITQINRCSKNETVFSCNFFKYKKIKKILKNKEISIISLKNYGFFAKMLNIFKNYGVFSAIILFFILYVIQYNFIWQYQIEGVENIKKTEIVEYVKKNYSNNKIKLDAKALEIDLLKNFEKLSFVSCIIRGQTLVINLKEKLQPSEIYGEFKPIISNKNAKIKSVELISGTLSVKAGDFVKVGDILVEPFTIDASGVKRYVQPKAKIVADVFNEGVSEHCAHKVEIFRTGNVKEKNVISLFGLEIYSYTDKQNFEMCEFEEEISPLIKNNILPFKIKKIKIFELSKREIESDFEEVKEEFIEKARQNALENVDNCDTIIREYYSFSSMSEVTFVNYCVVTEEMLG